MENHTYQLTFVITFLFITVLSVVNSAKVRSANDFSIANRSLKSTGVSWIIIGTLVGGISTVGTVQTAYTYGITAGIFTFGSALSCLILGCFFTYALRNAGVVTVSEYLGRSFGTKFRYYCSAINSIGMFIHVVGQFLASIAILQTVFGFANGSSVLITLVLMSIFVLSGGVSGAGLIGKIKFFMLYLIMLTSGCVAINAGDGMTNIISRLPVELDMLGFSRYGMKNTVLDMFSMIVGVLSTQIYLQAIFSAKDVREARNGAFLSAAIIPPIGVLGIIVGLYLRAHHPEVGANPAQALPYFLQHMYSPAVAAFFSAGLLLVVLGTGTGLVLGVTTNIYNDFIAQENRLTGRMKSIRLIRLSGLAVLICATLLVFTGLDSAILKWSYMSMGLRGSAVFAGLCVIVFFRRLVRYQIVLYLLILLPPAYLILSII